MDTISSVEFQKKFGYYQDRALVEPVILTRNGRQRLVLLSVEEFSRLKLYDRESLPVSALSEADLLAIAVAEVPAEYATLDHELGA